MSMVENPNGCVYICVCVCVYIYIRNNNIEEA